MAGRAPVTFEPAGVTVWVVPGTTVLEAARRAGVVVPAPCGGRGVCGSCGVRVVAGELAEPDDVETAGLSRASSGVRLACRARVNGPVSVRAILGQAQVVPRSEGALVSLVAGVDLGTTSVAASLVDAETGVELSRHSVPNRQQSFGADVLSRISAADGGEAAALRRAAEDSVCNALAGAAALVGVRVSGVQRLAVAGNTAMAALIAGAPVDGLGRYPFDAPEMDASLPADSVVRSVLAAGATALLLPPIAGFVGGDALAASLAAGLYQVDEPVLLVDFGTNAEIVLATPSGLTVASAAAGPAFEGEGISCGGPAVPGAVERVTIAEDGSITLGTIGAEPLRWLTGSGVVSAVAALRRAGHIEPDGRMLGTGPLAARFFTREDGVLAVALDDAREIVVTQLDVRVLQLAKAAVRTGIDFVLREAGLRPSDISRVLVAGAFGAALEPQDLVTLGVLWEGADGIASQVGNASLDGATTIALDPELLEVALRIARGAHAVELAADPGFTSALMAATRFEISAG